MDALGERLARLRAQISEAERRWGRAEGSVRLLAVSKLRAAVEVDSVAALGQRAFGENYVREALVKMAAVGSRDLEWHLIGPLQSNKTAEVAAHFDWVHSLDRERIARRLSTQRPQDLPPLRVCLQVNTSGEPSKAGVRAEDLPALAELVASLPRLELVGLMNLPEPVTGLTAQRREFAELARLAVDLRARGHRCPELSMGTTADLDAAIAEGATLVRVGTGLFGPRPEQAN
ncbi:MAG TPA: YggS family pyridoxal phosphate-dependent enzyme [Gammaproteobacteria bacterium]|nr:YggS family pyridoxal phosphate-dependent enzyme [Gammaproteobacteria bacterium]